jgi:hypothetical protein
MKMQKASETLVPEPFQSVPGASAHADVAYQRVASATQDVEYFDAGHNSVARRKLHPTLCSKRIKDVELE